MSQAKAGFVVFNYVYVPVKPVDFHDASVNFDYRKYLKY